MTSFTREDIPTARRIVVKVGSSSISGENSGKIQPIVEALVEAHASGTEVVLVSSGAIATGMPYLRLGERPTDLATQQAAAARTPAASTPAYAIASVSSRCPRFPRIRRRPPTPTQSGSPHSGAGIKHRTRDWLRRLRVWTRRRMHASCWRRLQCRTQGSHLHHRPSTTACVAFSTAHMRSTY